MKIVIIGTGGMAKEIWGLCTDVHNVVGFVSEKQVSDGIFSLQKLVFFTFDTEFLEAPPRHCVIANGHPATRRKIAGMYLGSGHDFPNITHSNAAIFGHLELGRGVTIMPGGVIQPDVFIGDFVHINMGATIGHDVTIGQYSVINHNAGISGNVRIGEACLIGAGAIIIGGNTIGDGATVGAGAVITKDVPAGETWVGVPARRLETKNPTYAELYKGA